MPQLGHDTSRHLTPLSPHTIILLLYIVPLCHILGQFFDIVHPTCVTLMAESDTLLPLVSDIPSLTPPPG